MVSRLVMLGEGGDKANMVCTQVLTCRRVSGREEGRTTGREKGKRGVIS